MNIQVKSAIIFVAALSTAAHAARWERVSESTAGILTYVDISSVKGGGDNRQVWVKYDMSRVKSGKVSQSKELVNVDCKYRTITSISYIELAADGSVIKTTTIPEEMRKANPAPRASVGDAIAMQVCAE